MILKNFIPYLLGSLLTGLLLAGCGNKFSKMSDEELEQKYQECQMVKNPQPGTAIACGNIEKEYNKRNG